MGFGQKAETGKIFRVVLSCCVRSWPLVSAAEMRTADFFFPFFLSHCASRCNTDLLQLLLGQCNHILCSSIEIKSQGLEMIDIICISCVGYLNLDAE